jgi:neutral ceramidase
MRKAGRILWRAGVGLALLTVGACLLCLDTVDYHPYFRQSYGAQTAARFLARAPTNTVVRGELAAGFGRALLSPTLNSSPEDPARGRFHSLPLAGYGDRHGRFATGVHDDLYVKSVALRVGDTLGVVLSGDALIIPPEVTEAAMERLAGIPGLSRERVYLSATHTHCGLGGWGQGLVAESFAGSYQPGVRAWFVGRLVSAAQDAIQDLQPASVGHGHFNAANWVRNRLVGEQGQVDPEFSFLLFRQQTGKTAVLGSFAAHATVLSGDMLEFSADFPGCWQRAVEQATGGTAIYLAGGVGSHSPAAPERGFPGAERMGRALADALLQQLPATPLTNLVAFGMEGLEMSLPPLNVRLSDGLRLRPWLARRLLPVRSKTFIQALRLNDALWVSTPCDFSGELALGIKDFFRARGTTAVVTSFNGDYIGYVIPCRYYHLPGYEPRIMSFFGPNVPDYLDHWVRTLAARVAAE